MRKHALVGPGLLAAMVVSACGHGMHGDITRDPEKAKAFVDKRLDSMLSELKATDAQREKITAVKEKLFPKALAMMGEQKKSREQLLALWLEPTVDQAKVNALLDARESAMRDFSRDLEASLTEVHDVLTPEQRAQVAEHVKQFSNYR